MLGLLVVVGGLGHSGEGYGSTVRISSVGGFVLLRRA
jgi:hypothetical protein